MIEKIKNLTPKVAGSAFVHKTAVVSGAVTLAAGASVWPCAVLRADIAPITIGPNSNVQDNAAIHVNYNRPAVIGSGVSIGHGAVVHGAIVGDNCLIGMNAVVLECEIGENCLIGAGSVLTAGKSIPPRSLVIGVPAKVARELTDEEVAHIQKNAAEYIGLAKIFKEESAQL